MKNIFELAGIAIRIVIGSIFFTLLIQAIINPAKNKEVNTCPTYYDGEGNPIPDNAVNLLVKAQFVWMTAKEIDTIQKYFYLEKHICPYKNCTMKDQIVFHGCSVCEEGTDCYALDAVHWDYPTLTYDECEEILFGKPMYRNH